MPLCLAFAPLPDAVVISRASVLQCLEASLVVPVAQPFLLSLPLFIRSLCGPINNLVAASGGATCMCAVPGQMAGAGTISAARAGDLVSTTAACPSVLRRPLAVTTALCGRLALFSLFLLYFTVAKQPHGIHNLQS